MSAVRHDDFWKFSSHRPAANIGMRTGCRCSNVSLYSSVVASVEDPKTFFTN